MLTPVSEQPVPSQIVALAEERSRARAARDWSTADELRGRIEAAGWRVVDADLDYSLSPARPPDIDEGGRILYGSPDAVTPRSDKAEAPGATVVLLVDAAASQVAAQLAGLHEQVPSGTPLLVTATPDVDPADLDLASEVVWTVDAWPAGAALRAALRRVTSSTVVVLGQEIVPVGDIVTPLVTVLADETVAIAGSAGLVSADLWHYDAAASGDVTVVTADCYAFRRRDGQERDQLDDRLQSPGAVATWLSLTLRDEGTAVPPRRAVAVALPLRPPSTTAPPHGDQTHLARRDRYRIAERFKGRTDLAHGAPVHGMEPSREGEAASC